MKLMRKMVQPVIWLIVAAFLLWGVQSVFVSLQESTSGVGRAFGKTVSFKSFQDAMKSTELLLQTAGNEKIDTEILEETTWRNIVLSMQADREKIKATDEEVKLEIERLFSGQDRAFDPRFYEAWVQQTYRESPRAFEERIRNIISVRKLVALHQNTESTPPTDEDVKIRMERGKTLVSLRYITFDNLSAAAKSKTEMEQPEFWNRNPDSKDTDLKIQSLDHVSLQTVITLLGLSEANVKTLESLEPAAVSEPIAAQNGVYVFRLLEKKLDESTASTPDEFDALKKQMVQERNVEVFAEWYRSVMMKANVVKFKSKIPSIAEPA